MQPDQTPNLQPSPNQQPTPGAPEQAPAAAPEAPMAPAAPEVAPQVPQSAPAAPAQVPQIPQAPNPAAPAQSQAPAQKLAAPTTSATPAVAADVDIIEKEWVDQANRVVDQTKDDPYVQEEAVESLQQDYLKKRYGHDVKKPGEA